MCRSKHVELSINFGITNSITRLHLVLYFYGFILRCTNPWIKKKQYEIICSSITMQKEAIVPCPLHRWTHLYCWQLPLRQQQKMGGGTVAFSWQKWLRERASIGRCTSVAFLVAFALFCVSSEDKHALTNILNFIHFNPLKTKRRLIYLKTQSVPRCKHFSSRL